MTKANEINLPLGLASTDVLGAGRDYVGDWPYSPPLMCGVNYIGSGAAPGVVVLDMIGDDCCDMGGAIRVCEALWPGCHTIKTSNACGADTEYRKTGGQWVAIEAHNFNSTTPPVC
jgi:hypothetical protein